MSLCEQLGTVTEYFLLRTYLSTQSASSSLFSHLTCSRPKQTKGTQPGLGNLQRIHWRAKPHEALDAEPANNFVLSHQEWVQPGWVLKDNVSLFGISGDGATVTFTVTEPKVDVYSSDHGPFMYITQYKLATHLVTMDITTFTQLADSIAHQDVKVILVANTGRCGSTLLAQMFEAVEGTRVLSEPHSLLDVLYLHNRKKVDDKVYKHLVKSIMKVHIECARQRTEETNTLVFKPVFKCTPQIKLMADGFPGTSVLFLYRDVSETVVSFQRVMAAFTTLARFFTTDQEMALWWVEDLPLPLPHSSYKWSRDPEMLEQLSMASAMALNYCCTAVCVRDYIKQGLGISCLDYKDLVTRPSEAWSALASYCGLDPTSAKPLEAHKKDSQRGAFLSRGVLRPAGKVDKEETWHKDLTRFLEAFDMTAEMEFLPNLLSTSDQPTHVLDLEND